MISMSAHERAALAKAVGLHEQYLYQCFTRRRTLPAEHCAAVEQATGGKVTRRDLRPEDWQRIWPELADAKAA